MVSHRIETLLHGELARLPEPLQERVLEFARGLGSPRPPGTPVFEFLKFAGTIPAEDLDEIAQIIERDCEQIDPNGW